MTVADVVLPAADRIDDPGLVGQTDILLPEGSRIVHIGPHKTGTTGLQAALYMAREDLDRQGVHYASEGRHAMTPVLAGLGLPSSWSSDGRPPPRWKWQRLLTEVRMSGAKRVVLSSEFFADGEPDGIQRVVEELDPSRVQVVVTLRPLSKIIPSQWQQWVQNQVVTPLDEWVESLLDQPRHGPSAQFWHRHRHDALIARWAEIVGPERVTAVALDDGDRDMVLRVFERLTGLESGTLKPVSDLSNRSMTYPEIEVIRAFNIAFRDQKLPKQLYSRVMRFGAAALMEARVPEADEPRIELPAWSVDRIAAISHEMVASIRASGVRVVGDLEAMTAVPAGRSPEAGPVSVSPKVAASAAMGVLVASGLARGTAPITAEDGEEPEDEEKAKRAPRPVQEPPELLRVSTAQLGIVILRRSRAALTDRVRGLLRRPR